MNFPNCELASAFAILEYQSSDDILQIKFPENEL
jgi:hypothetical protein